MQEDLIVIGTERKRGRPSVALLAREEDGALRYVGSAMVTLVQRERDAFWKAIDQLKAPAPAIKMAKHTDADWVEPRMKVRVRTLRGEEKLRHASMLAISTLPQASAH